MPACLPLLLLLLCAPPRLPGHLQNLLQDVLRALHPQLDELSADSLVGLMGHVAFLRAEPSEAWLATFATATLARYGELSTEQLLELANCFVFLRRAPCPCCFDWPLLMQPLAEAASAGARQ